MAKVSKVACIIAAGFEDSEFRIPYDRLTQAGFPVDIIGAEAGQELKGMSGKETIKTTHAIGSVKPEDYQELLIPGGHSPDQLRGDKRFVEFVQKFDALKRPVAAVCHGPQLLIAAGLVKGRTLTAWKTIQEDLKLMGANVKDEPVVTDQNWITSRKPEDLNAFSEAAVKALR